MIIIAILIFIGLLNLKLAVDLKQFHSRKPINHKLEAVFVSVALTALSWWVGWKSLPMWFFGWTVFFDLGWNILAGNKLLYVGETAYLDKLQRKYPFLQWLRYILFAASIIFYIYA